MSGWEYIIYGPVALLILVIGIVITLYLVSIGAKGKVSGSKGWTPYFIASVVVIVIWWQFATGLWAVSIILIAGGFSLLLWDKTPAIAKTIGGLMLGGGTIMVVAIYLFGADNVESSRMALQSAVAGKNAPPKAPLTAEEQTRRVALAVQDAEVAAAQRTTEAKAQVEADIAVQRAYEDSYLPAEEGPCLKLFTDKLDCVTVQFEARTKYDRYAPPGYCIMVVGNGVEWTPLGGTGYHRYKAEVPTVVQFFTESAENCGS